MNNEDTLRPEYPADLIKSGVRGKYANRYREGTNIVLVSYLRCSVGHDSPSLQPSLKIVYPKF